MLQFVLALVMGINAIRIGCDFPMWMQYACCLYMVSFLVLFSDFYYKVGMSGTAATTLTSLSHRRTCTRNTA